MIANRTHTVINLEQRSCISGDLTIRYWRGSLYAPPFDIKPTLGEHDYKTCSTCQENRSTIAAQLKERSNRFPNCCDSHRKLVELPCFTVNDFCDSNIKCAEKVIFSYQHVINNPDNHQSILEYLKLVIESFGVFPKGYGEPFLLSDYCRYLKDLISQNTDISTKTKCIIEEYLSSLYENKSGLSDDPVAQICELYNRWLDTFPFGIPFFEKLKVEYRAKTPFYFKYENNSLFPERGRYILKTGPEYIQLLESLTKDLLSKCTAYIRTLSTTNEESLIYFHKIVSERCVFQSIALLSLNADDSYVNIIDKWLEIQCEYLEQISSAVKQIDNSRNDNYPNDSYKESLTRVEDLKQYLENNALSDIIREKEEETFLQALFHLIWNRSSFDVNRETNNGHGCVDFKISKGSSDVTIIEFKLASNTNFKSNITNQVEVYNKANKTNKSITVIFCFTQDEIRSVKCILQNTGLIKKENYIIIDCIRNKPSASKRR